MREQLGEGRLSEIKVWGPGIPRRPPSVSASTSGKLVEELEAPRFRIVEEKLVAK